MRKIALLMMLGILLTLSVSMAQDILVLSSQYDQNYSITDDVLNNIDVEFEWIFASRQEQWNYDDLTDYGIVIVNQRFGYTNAAVMEELYDYTAAGGKLIWVGGTSHDQTWIGSFQNDFEIECTYLYVNPGGFELTDPTHPMAVELPEDHPLNVNSGRIWVNIDDDVDAFETVAINNQDMPMLGVQQINNSGEFIFIGVDTYYSYWTPQGDTELYEQMMLNAIEYVRGSMLYGTITNSTTHQPVLNVTISLYDFDTDTLVSEDLSDSMGYYECSYYLLEGCLYYATYDKELYVGQRLDDLEGIPPDNIMHNLDFVPFLQTDLEAIQTEVPRNTWVDVSGIVTIPTNATDLEHTSFYIQDETQYGVHIYADDPWDAETYGDLNRGDEVRIVGRLDEYDDITEITELYLWEVLSTDNAVYDPLTMNSGTMSNMQEMEGTWAHIVGYLQNDPAQMGSYSIILNDGSGDCNVRVEAPTGIDLTEWEQGDWLMVNGVIGLFEGTVQLIPALDGDVFRTVLYAPRYPAVTALDSLTGVVAFEWEHYSFAPLFDLTYDDGGTPRFSHQWPGYTMSTRMSPGGACQLMGLKYYIVASEATEFTAAIFEWDDRDEMPETEPLYEWTVEVGPFEGWYELVLVDEAIMISEDFVVGFGSVNNRVEVGGSTTDNGRSWDYGDGEWTHWTNTYYIRAAVQYPRGNVAYLDPWQQSGGELDEWQSFNVYRDGDLIREGLRMISYTDTMPEFGAYEYTITAIYHEDETDPYTPLMIYWGVNDVGEQTFVAIPNEWSIEAIYPNPFNPTVNVVLGVPQAGLVRAEIFDILGRTVEVLDQGKLQPGHHNISWNAKGSAGVYFMKVTDLTSGWSDIRKLVYMK
ncbi:MAG: T9SS type A sorting domain-containing protein [Candidatus Electryonea clarkiae]|nr:T9SS type A sorting domain-containing protein [Candidatus Electryonea clarkiae]MDP8288297.1 T9SS type A sorting domain-containing protein [Candidatus Electryonea clarkiae]